MIKRKTDTTNTTRGREKREIKMKITKSLFKCCLSLQEKENLLVSRSTSLSLSRERGKVIELCVCEQKDREGERDSVC